jgi:hypothetical protein
MLSVATKQRKKEGKDNRRNKLVECRKLHIKTEYDKFDLNGYACELSSNTFIPATRENQVKERNFFNFQFFEIKFFFVFI